MSRTTASLQVVPNPLFVRNAPRHDDVFAALQSLKADDVRYIAWMPQPRLAVAALEPPRAGKTSWDFTLLDPLMADFMAAMQGRRVMMNFSTIPQWMFVTDQPEIGRAHV